MISIFVNNFRGFSDTVLPIRRVNFFVGENSTGKSSLLSLLELFSSPEFWFNLDFNTTSYEFGGYSDIVSALSEDKSEFQIGLCKPDDEDPERNDSYMLHFRRGKDGLPKLVRFTRLCPRHIATLRVSDKQIAACLSTDVPKLADCSSAKECFGYLLDAPARLRSGYKVLSGDFERFARQSPVGNFTPIIIHLFRHYFDNSEFGISIGAFAFPNLSSSFAAMAPIRTTPKRTYDGYTKRFSPDGEHTPYVIREKLPRTNSRTNPFKEALEAFGRESGLFQTLGITQFGEDSAAPFELTVTLNTTTLRVNSVGYGVSQSLPVVVELLTHGRNSWLAIQQPEVHLHPRAQAALGDVLFHSAIEEAQTLFVETHSDYLLDRFRLKMRDHDHPSNLAQVVFFERSDAGNTICPMLIDSSGKYPQNQPPGFRAFFLQEQRRILEV